MQTIKEGSIIIYRDLNTYTMSIVDKVKGKELYCKHSICSLDNGDTFIRTQQVYPKYEGEEIEDVRLCNPAEFYDVVMDNFSRDLLIDVS